MRSKHIIFYCVRHFLTRVLIMSDGFSNKPPWGIIGGELIGGNTVLYLHIICRKRSSIVSCNVIVSIQIHKRFIKRIDNHCFRPKSMNSQIKATETPPAFVCFLFVCTYELVCVVFSAYVLCPTLSSIP